MRSAIRGAKLAAKQGKIEPAIELLKHTAAFDDAGKERRPMAGSVDRQVAQTGSGAPIIQIGIGLGKDFDALIARQQPAIEASAIEAETIPALPAGTSD
jgi:hypothetical protein